MITDSFNGKFSYSLVPTCDECEIGSSCSEIRSQGFEMAQCTSNESISELQNAMDTLGKLHVQLTEEESVSSKMMSGLQEEGDLQEENKEELEKRMKNFIRMHDTTQLILSFAIIVLIILIFVIIYEKFIVHK
mmetsp:Transcript_37193/g.37873  ORF Transcript_37193/g.37873 Transcript_37193/m.37873 type:complete len:133 (-) Transcript_37193:58-456(-)